MNIKKIILPFLLLLNSACVLAMPQNPTLIEFKLEQLGPTFSIEPTEVNLQVGQSYVFLIENKYQTAVNLSFEKFGENIMTHYLEGVPGMSRNGMMIPLQGRVTWVFDIKKPGVFQMFANDMGMGQKSQPTKINVLSEDGSMASQEDMMSFEALKAQLDKETQKRLDQEQKEKGDSNQKVAKQSSKPKPWKIGGRPD